MNQSLLKTIYLFLCCLPICGQGQTLVLHQTPEMQIDDGSIIHWVSELERATGLRWKVRVDLIREEVSDIYEAQRKFGANPGYHLSVSSPDFHNGYYWIIGMGYALGCTPKPYRVATCSFSRRNLSGSRAACLHELGHLLGAGHSRGGVMRPTNNGAQYFSRKSIGQIRLCKKESFSRFNLIRRRYASSKKYSGYNR